MPALICQLPCTHCGTFDQSRADEVRARYALAQGLAVGYARGDLGQMLAQLYPQEKTI
jgi:hypothetical protein